MRDDDDAVSSPGCTVRAICFSARVARCRSDARANRRARTRRQSAIAPTTGWRCVCYRYFRWRIASSGIHPELEERLYAPQLIRGRPKRD